MLCWERALTNIVRAYGPTPLQLYSNKINLYYLPEKKKNRQSLAFRCMNSLGKTWFTHLAFAILAELLFFSDKMTSTGYLFNIGYRIGTGICFVPYLDRENSPA